MPLMVIVHFAKQCRVGGIVGFWELEEDDAWVVGYLKWDLKGAIRNKF